MAHSALIKRPSNLTTTYSASYGSSSGKNGRLLGGDSFPNTKSNLNRTFTNLDYKSRASHHLSTPTGSPHINRARVPIRADHSLVSNLKLPRQHTTTGFSPLNRQKSSSLGNLSSTSKYRTVHEKIKLGEEKNNDRYFSSMSSVRDQGEQILRNAKQKLEKLNSDWGLTKPLHKRYSSVSDITSTKSENRDVLGTRTVTKKRHGSNINTNEDRTSLIESRTLTSIRNKQDTISSIQRGSDNFCRASSDITHTSANRVRRNSIDNSSIRSYKNVSSDSDTATTILQQSNCHMSTERIIKGSNKSDEYRSGIVGLRNLGNTCFMNSILQCLCKSKELRSYFYNKDYKKDINEQFKPTRGRLTMAFGDLMHDIWSSSSIIAISPTHLKSEVERFAPRFSGSHQHDSQEFLRFFIEGIHDELNAIKCKPTYNNTECNDLCGEEQGKLFWNQYLSRENSKIQGLFVGQLRSTLTCSVCGHRSLTYDPFWDLSLPISPRKGQEGVKINECFKMFTQEETLDGDEKPTCEKCKKRRKCTKRFLIERFPKILVLHLKRFSGHRFRTKLSTKVIFPMQLNISEFAANPSDSKDYPEYSLFGVSNHMGGTGGGHYTAYCKHPDTGKWHLYNDSRVTEAISDNVVSPSAYVLFYSLINTSGYG